jgi:hypothetical protein
MKFRVENYSVRVQHKEKTRSLAKRVLSKSTQDGAVFVKSIHTLNREFTQQERNHTAKILYRIWMDMVESPEESGVVDLHFV